MKPTTDDVLIFKAVLLYIISHSEERKRDVYSIVKTAFYAQQISFAKWGSPIFNDEICALPFGPAPSNLYGVLRMARGEEREIGFHRYDDMHLASDAIDYENERFSVREEPDLDYLSRADVECLDEAIKKVAAMSFDEIVSATHGEEWARVYNNAIPGRKVMDNLNIAREGGASEAIVEYLSEYFSLKLALGC